MSKSGKQFHRIQKLHLHNKSQLNIPYPDREINDMLYNSVGCRYDNMCDVMSVESDSNCDFDDDDLFFFDELSVVAELLF
jgi:hypothetical protein